MSIDPLSSYYDRGGIKVMSLTAIQKGSAVRDGWNIN